MRRVAVIDRIAAGIVLGVAVGVWADGSGPLSALSSIVVLGLATWSVWRRSWMALACCVGVAWGGIDQQSERAHLQDACSDGVTAMFVGRVSGLPQSAPGVSRFDFDPDRIAAIGGCAPPGPRRLRVSWYEGPTVQPGERWVLEVRLRALRSYRNPGGFDYVEWALERGIDVSGTVRRGLRVEPETAADRMMRTQNRDAWRDRVARWIDGHGLTHAGLLRALAIGDARDVDSATWEVFRTTGTIHLLVISGLHIAIAAACGLLIGRATARALPGHLRHVGEHRIGAVCAVLATVAYSAIADFSLPVTRACLMAVAGIGWWLWGRRLPPHRALLLSLLLIVGVDPVSLDDGSLWLSAGAVAVLVAYFAYRRGLPFSSGFFRTQWVLFIAMVPIFTSTVGQFAWIAPLANLAAVPLVSLILVPLLLGALLFALPMPWLASALLALADRVTSMLLEWLDFVAHSPVTYVDTPDSVLLALAAVASSAVLLPLRARQRVWLVPLVGAVFLHDEVAIPWGEVQATVLDVGQGLAVIADTARHRLLYDTGPAYPSGFDLGSAVVVPALRATGPLELDLVMLSHGDVDHRGGFGAIERLAVIKSVLSGIPGDASACRRGQAWQWDGVVFRVLHPDARPRSDNDGSCVLSIQARGGRALLPGDITSAVERDLTRADRSLAVDLLVAPHHGSRTSSSAAFVAAVAPAVVAVSAGHRNRFGHPHAAVVDRYRAGGADLAVTAAAGALVWRSDDAGRLSDRIGPGRSATAQAAIRGDE